MPRILGRDYLDKSRPVACRIHLYARNKSNGGIRLVLAVPAFKIIFIAASAVVIYNERIPFMAGLLIRLPL